MTEPEPTRLRRRRGVVKASITRIAKNLRDLESKADDPSTLDHAQRIAEELDLEFKEHHGVLIDLIVDCDEDVLQKEQEALDEHDDECWEVPSPTAWIHTFESANVGDHSLMTTA